jgi:hypothetical protein
MFAEVRQTFLAQSENDMRDYTTCLWSDFGLTTSFFGTLEME